ncbi:hypothetical protein Tco_0337805 [Tanacetum coccineum]
MESNNLPQFLTKGSILVNGSLTEEQSNFYKGLKQGTKELVKICQSARLEKSRNPFESILFPQGHDPRSKKASWVNWNKVLTAKERGGLGVSSLYALNRGLMCKWVWRFFAHKSLLWSRVIKAIHGPEGGLITDVRRGFRSTWTSIVQEVKKLQNQGVYGGRSEETNEGCTVKGFEQDKLSDIDSILDKDAGIFTGVRIDASTMISHLFYADDAVFIGEWSQTNIRGIMHTLHCLSTVVRLYLFTFRKQQSAWSGVFFFSKALEAANSLAWDESINKLKTRLSKWKLKTLSIGGRLTLLKSVLGSTPIYNMSLYKVPKAVLSSMEAIRRDFFNGSKDNDRKNSDGLKCTLNVWRYISQCESLQSRIYSCLSRSNWKGSLLATYPSIGVFTIVKEVKVLKDQDYDFLTHCKMIGQWQVDKDCYVDIKLKVPVASSFRRMVRGGVEASQLAQLNDILGSVSVSNSEDRWVWDMNGDGVFRVKDVRNLLDETFLPEIRFPYKVVRSIPIKLITFTVHWKESLLVIVSQRV